MVRFLKNGNAIEFRHEHEKVRIEPWGTDSIRVRAAVNAEILDRNFALLDQPAIAAEISIAENSASLKNGKIMVEVSGDGRIRFLKTGSGTSLIEEIPFHSLLWPFARDYKSLGSEFCKTTCRFKAYDDEKIFGLGQHRHGLMNQKGCVLPLEQRNCEINIPFALSNRGYGFLWNNPAIGRVEFAANGTTWTADACRQIDYWITCGDTPADIIENYTSVTGRAPMLPEFASGFWQSKARYKSQDELLRIAREYKKRGLPISVIVSDFFHYVHMGDWKFDPVEWPDPEGMVQELEKMGIKLMVSIWPTVSPMSENYAEMNERGLLLQSERGKNIYNKFKRKAVGDVDYLHYYDPSNPEARKFVWEKVRENYYRHGIKVWWLDAIEPELYPNHPENVRYHAGNGLEVGNLYPIWSQMGFYEGMKSEGEDEIIMLCRSAWAGSQKYAAAVWSGDIFPTFESLRQQVRAGLNIALSGIPWWTTDIGGFVGGNPEDPGFRELIVRWFQYGAFCPLFRLHGARDPWKDGSGAANEVWSFGEEAYGIIKEYMFMRERLRPYIMEQMKAAHEKGTPVMRPMFYDFPGEEKMWEIDDQYMFGPDILVAPILHEGATQRKVRLPSGCDWVDAWTGTKITGSEKVTADAPLDRIPLYTRTGSNIQIVD